MLSLTIVRMIPVAIALMGDRTPRDDVLLIGWLGPRGLASIVFGLLTLEVLGQADGGFVASVIAVTVALSVILHGLTAGPVASWYARRHPAPAEAASGDHD